jgi:hypothetical protein
MAVHRAQNVSFCLLPRRGVPHRCVRGHSSENGGGWHGGLAREFSPAASGGAPQERRGLAVILGLSAGRRPGVTFHRAVSSSPATGRLALKPARAEFITAGKESTMKVLKAVLAALPVLAALLLFPAGTGGLAGLHLQGTFQPVITSSTTAEGTYSVQFHFDS